MVVDTKDELNSKIVETPLKYLAELLVLPAQRLHFFHQLLQLF